MINPKFRIVYLSGNKQQLVTMYGKCAGKSSRPGPEGGMGMARMARMALKGGRPGTIAWTGWISLGRGQDGWHWGVGGWMEL